MNKYLISVDIEGITGVINKNFAKKNGIYYQLGCKYLLSDLNAVIQGIVNADSDAYIVVRDAHEDAVNINLEYLHPKARLIQGWGASQNILCGLDESFNGVFLVGYHASGKNNIAVLGHTMSSMVHFIKINDTYINETGFAAFYASHYNVPIVFVSGDNHTISEAHDQLGVETIGVVVKQSFARDSAESLSLSQAKELLAQGAYDAVCKLRQSKFTSFKVLKPITIEIGFYNSGFRISIFQKLAEILGFDDTYQFDHNDLSITFTSSDVLEVFNRMNMLMFLICGIRATG